jgi:hypothetical protein
MRWVMRNPFFHGVGGVLSTDIAVPDHERELGFYSKVLTTGPAPLWRNDLTNNQGAPVIGLTTTTTEERERGFAGVVVEVHPAAHRRASRVAAARLT